MHMNVHFTLPNSYFMCSVSSYKKLPLLLSTLTGTSKLKFYNFLTDAWEHEPLKTSFILTFAIICWSTDKSKSSIIPQLPVRSHLQPQLPAIEEALFVGILPELVSKFDLCLSVSMGLPFDQQLHCQKCQKWLNSAIIEIKVGKRVQSLFSSAGNYHREKTLFWSIINCASLSDIFLGKSCQNDILIWTVRCIQWKSTGWQSARQRFSMWRKQCMFVFRECMYVTERVKSLLLLKT